MPVTGSDLYQPVGCGIYDMLEAAAVRRTATEIRSRDQNGEAKVLMGTVADVHARGAEEYIRLEGGAEVRWDRVRSVDGVRDGRCILP